MNCVILLSDNNLRVSSQLPWVGFFCIFDEFIQNLVKEHAGVIIEFVEIE